MRMRDSHTTIVMKAVSLLGCLAVAGTVAMAAGAATPTQQQYGNPGTSAALTPPKPVTPPAVPADATPGVTTPTATTPTVTTPAVQAAAATQTLTPSNGGTLPFTGLQLGLVVAFGLILLSFGFVIRRAGRNREL